MNYDENSVKKLSDTQLQMWIDVLKLAIGERVPGANIMLQHMAQGMAAYYSNEAMEDKLIVFENEKTRRQMSGGGIGRGMRVISLRDYNK